MTDQGSLFDVHMLEQASKGLADAATLTGVYYHALVEQHLPHDVVEELVLIFSEIFLSGAFKRPGEDE